MNCWNWPARNAGLFYCVFGDFCYNEGSEKDFGG